MSILKLYYAIILFLSIVVIAVLSSITVVHVSKRLIISNTEYQAKKFSKMTIKEISSKRNSDLKEALIDNISWIMCFGIVILIHRKKWIKINEKED